MGDVKSRSGPPGTVDILFVGTGVSCCSESCSGGLASSSSGGVLLAICVYTRAYSLMTCRTGLIGCAEYGPRGEGQLQHLHEGVEGTRQQGQVRALHPVPCVHQPWPRSVLQDYTSQCSHTRFTGAQPFP